MSASKKEADLARAGCAPVVAFFGLKGGQGRTTLVHHLAWMFSDHGVPVVAADLDPQCDLTQRFLGPEAAAALAASGQTVHASFCRFVEASAGSDAVHLVHPGGDVALLAGDVSVFALEPVLADAFRVLATGDARAARTMLAFRSLFTEAAKSSAARVVLVDLAPSGGFVNRAVLAAADYLVVPLVPDAFAVKTLRPTGEILDRWREDWRPHGEMLRGVCASWSDDGPQPLGYVVQMFPMYAGHPTTMVERSMNDIPVAFGRWIAKSQGTPPRSPREDERCIGVIAPFSVLFPNAADAHRPVFHLTPAEGAVGSMMGVVQRARADYESVAHAIARRIGIQSE